MIFRLIFGFVRFIYSIFASSWFLFTTFQILFIISLCHISMVFFVEQPKTQYKYQPYIPIDGESQWYSLPVERCHLTVLIACNPKVNHIGHEYDHIERNLDNLSRFKQRLFHPCIVLFNQDIDYKDILKKVVDDFSKKHEAVVDVINYPGKVGQDSTSRAKIFYEMMRLFKKTYILDDFNSVEESVTRVIGSSDAPLLFMDESAIICSRAISHLSLVFEHMQHLGEKGKDWSSYRLSHGMSGTIINRKDIITTIDYFEKKKDSRHSLKYLLDNFFLDNPDFKDRISFRFRFQLLSLGKSQKSQCYETQSDFDLESCSHSLFSPCQELIKKKIDTAEVGNANSEFVHNTAMLPSFAPTHRFSLSDLKNVESVFCDSGENCNQCCSKLGAKCDVSFFEYINRCDEFDKFTKNCKCSYEKGSSSSSLPAMKHGNCYLGFRASDFNCHNSHALTRRLCPCILK